MGLFDWIIGLTKKVQPESPSPEPIVEPVPLVSSTSQKRQ